MNISAENAVSERSDKSVLAFIITGSRFLLILEYFSNPSGFFFQGINNVTVKPAVHYEI